jgi:DNA-binding XRE family transcriptional regulator
MSAATVHLHNKTYVIVEQKEYQRLLRLARAAELPSLPGQTASGNYPAVEYARVSLARKIIRNRVNAGLTQRELAQRAGIRVETLCRIETGKNVPSMATMIRIDRVLKQAEQRRSKRSPRS